LILNKNTKKSRATTRNSDSIEGAETTLNAALAPIRQGLRQIATTC